MSLFYTPLAPDTNFFGTALEEAKRLAVDERMQPWHIAAFITDRLKVLQRHFLEFYRGLSCSAAALQLLLFRGCWCH